MTSTSDTVQAVFMPAPGRPLETRRLPAPRVRPAARSSRPWRAKSAARTSTSITGGFRGFPIRSFRATSACGRVLESGGPLADIEGRPIADGALVTFYDVYGICGKCWHCLVARAATRCPHRKVYGITAPAADGLLGGWSQQIEILPGVRLVPSRRASASRISWAAVVACRPASTPSSAPASPLATRSSSREAARWD